MQRVLVNNQKANKRCRVGWSKVPDTRWRAAESQKDGRNMVYLTCCYYCEKVFGVRLLLGIPEERLRVRTVRDCLSCP